MKTAYQKYGSFSSSGNSFLHFPHTAHFSCVLLIFLYAAYFSKVHISFTYFISFFKVHLRLAPYTALIEIKQLIVTRSDDYELSDNVQTL